MLIALSGLPGTGKTTIARLLSRRLPAVHVRIDTIEQALLRAGYAAPLGPEGYVVAYGAASDNLRLGHHVVADCVNAARASREAWDQVAGEWQARVLHVHLVCSDVEEHRRRLSARHSDIPGHVLPGWTDVAALPFEPPAQGTLVIDTSALSANQAADLIIRRAG